MIDPSNIDAIAKQAKEKLRKQKEEIEETVDFYADLRSDFQQDVESDISIDRLGDEEDNYASIRRVPTEDDLDDLEELALDPFDAPIFENGPTRSHVELWKKEYAGHNVFALNILDEFFVVRTLNRFEYKQLVALESVNALQREEVICNTCVLFPQKYDFKSMAIAKGGIPSTLAQIIMEASGFTKEYQIQIL